MKLSLLATHQRQKCCQVLPQIRGNSKRSFAGPTPGVQSTKMAEPTKDLPTTLPRQTLNDVLVTDYEVKSLMYADQTGLFPAVSSLGNKYVMILHHIDSNSS
jgi:hypothetical protein